MDGTKIALMAHARSGKDYVAHHLWIRQGFDYHFKFADPIYEILRKLFPEQFADGRKPRELLQWFGQEMRSRDAEVWVKYLIRRVHDADSVFKNATFVVSDLRMPNEYDALKASGFAIVKIECSQETRIRRMEAAGDKVVAADLAHVTESYYDQLKPDYVIHNDTDDDSVLAQMDEVLDALRGAQ